MGASSHELASYSESFLLAYQSSTGTPSSIVPQSSNSEFGISGLSRFVLESLAHGTHAAIPAPGEQAFCEGAEIMK
jgi:hypothetical protein